MFHCSISSPSAVEVIEKPGSALLYGVLLIFHFISDTDKSQIFPLRSFVRVFGTRILGICGINTDCSEDRGSVKTGLDPKPLFIPVSHRVRRGRRVL